MIAGVSSLHLSENLPHVLHACVGSDVTFPWTVGQGSQHTFTYIQWYFHGLSKEVIAILSRDVFTPLPAFSDRIQLGSDGTLTLRHVTTEDSGNYTIEINGQDASGLAFTTRDNIYLQVGGKLYSSVETWPGNCAGYKPSLMFAVL